MSRAEFPEIRRFDTIGSTNSYLLEQARAGAPEGLVAVADHQSAGRGRLDRRWEAPPGTCLLVSVLLRPVLDPADLHLVTAAVALAALDACAAVAGVTAVLKWPNDLLVGGRKLAGILAESDPAAPGGVAGSLAVVVGMGLNVSWPGPAEAGGTSLEAAYGHRVDREALLEAWLAALGPRLVALRSVDGRADLAAGFRAHCDTLGRTVAVTTAAGEVTGTAVDLSAAGHLVVETDRGRVEVAAGDVVHVRPPSPPGGPAGLH